MVFKCKNCGKKIKGSRVREFCDRTCQERFEELKVTGVKEYAETNVIVPKEEEIVIPTALVPDKGSKKKRKSKKDVKDRGSF